MKKRTGLLIGAAATLGLSGLFGGKKADIEQQDVSKTPEPTPHVAMDERESPMLNEDDDLAIEPSMSIEEARLIAQEMEDTINGRFQATEQEVKNDKQQEIKTFAQEALTTGAAQQMEENLDLEIFDPTEREFELIKSRIGEDTLNDILMKQKAVAAIEWTMGKILTDAYETLGQDPSNIELFAFIEESFQNKSEQLKEAISHTDSLDIQYYSQLLEEKGNSIYNTLHHDNPDDIGFSYSHEKMSFDDIVKNHYPEHLEEIEKAKFTFNMEVEDGLTPSRLDYVIENNKEEPMTKEEYMAMNI